VKSIAMADDDTVTADDVSEIVTQFFFAPPVYGSQVNPACGLLYNGGPRGRAPSGVQGQSPWSGGQGAKPP